jgi:hypothetical protein
MSMHRGRDHDHLNGGESASGIPGVGHNRAGPPGKTAQWQTPHRSHPTTGASEGQQPESDLDLVEAAFVAGFSNSADPTSFLRLASIPFEAATADGGKLALLRVEIEAVADVGSVTPHFGGVTFRYDPLPASMVSRRQQLRFVYFDGRELQRLNLAQARALAGAIR